MKFSALHPKDEAPLAKAIMQLIRLCNEAESLDYSEKTFSRLRRLERSIAHISTVTEDHAFRKLAREIVHSAYDMISSGDQMQRKEISEWIARYREDLQ